MSQLTVEISDSSGTGYIDLTNSTHDSIRKAIAKADVFIFLLNSKVFGGSMDLELVDKIKSHRSDFLSIDRNRLLFVVNVYSSEAGMWMSDLSIPEIMENFRLDAVRFIERNLIEDFPGKQVLAIDSFNALRARVAKVDDIPAVWKENIRKYCFGAVDFDRSIKEKQCQELMKNQETESNIVHLEHLLQHVTRNAGSFLVQSIHDEFQSQQNSFFSVAKSILKTLADEMAVAKIKILDLEEAEILFGIRRASLDSDWLSSKIPDISREFPSLHWPSCEFSLVTGDRNHIVSRLNDCHLMLERYWSKLDANLVQFETLLDRFFAITLLDIQSRFSGPFVRLNITITEQMSVHFHRYPEPSVKFGIHEKKQVDHYCCKKKKWWQGGGCKSWCDNTKYEFSYEQDGVARTKQVWQETHEQVFSSIKGRWKDISVFLTDQIRMAYENAAAQILPEKQHERNILIEGCRLVEEKIANLQRLVRSVTEIAILIDRDDSNRKIKDEL